MNAITEFLYKLPNNDQRLDAVFFDGRLYVSTRTATRPEKEHFTYLKKCVAFLTGRESAFMLVGRIDVLISGDNIVYFKLSTNRGGYITVPESNLIDINLGQ